MPHHRRCLAFLFGAVIWNCHLLQAATPKQVEQAVRKGVEYLYSQQKDGNWEAVPKRQNSDQADVRGMQWGGRTGLVTYALLAAGESPQDERIKNALEFLYSADIQGTYAVSVRAQCWNFLPQTPAVRDAIKRDAELLGGFMRKGSDAQGMFGYEQKGTGYDHSTSNYGVLGFWAAAQGGYEIPENHWRAFDAGWRDHQYEDGSWSYKLRKGDFDAGDDEYFSTMSMTTAGVATLFITQDYLYANLGINCNGNIFDPNIERGIQWIARNFNTFSTGPRSDRAHYALYNVERVGVASGLKYMGDIDWYKTGGDWLVKKQGANGGWNNVVDTSFAILFLVRGRAPVVINKLAYSTIANGREQVAPWNERPRDAANIVRWIGRQIERDLNWQIVNLRVEADELHDAPILYMSGSQAFELSEENQQKLKQYVEQGGLILGNANAGRRAFADSFRRLGEKLFGGEFRELPPDHPIYNNQQFGRANWRTQPQLVGLSNGARELMLLFPSQDPARNWQLQGFMGPDREPFAQLLANIFLYSVDKQNLRTKGETYIVKPDAKTKAGRTIKVARLQYAGSWDPEPGGWRRLAAVMHNEHKVDLSIKSVKLGESKLDQRFPIAHLTGTGKFDLDDQAIAEIKNYIESGGTLVIDAAGGSKEFLAAAEAQLAKIFPDQASASHSLAVSHPLYGSANKITEVDYRSFARKQVGFTRAPRLRAIELGGRAAVIISPDDLSVGLVGVPIDGICGYIPFASSPSNRAGATELMTNIIVYAAETK